MNLDHSYTTAFPTLCSPAVPDIPTGTRLAWLNQPLAQDLGLDPDHLRTPEGLALLTGAHHPSYALAYSGHQFGSLSPLLGDGRAHLIGELTSPSGARTDIHLKGSGRTPYSRPGSDGKAPLSAVWREAVIGEALTALGVPASRALAILETGEKIHRRSPQPEPAGILIRTAASHLRIGTFQYAALNSTPETRQQLTHYSLTRHHPQENTQQPGGPALALFSAVARAQAQLTAQWMSLGFVHGVLNTDNVSISGQAIDFGPCAFIDRFTQDASYSSIDQRRRYSYRNQPAVTQWNLARFAETLIDLIDPEDPNRAVHLATDTLDRFEEDYQDARSKIFAQKFGLGLGTQPTGQALEKIKTFTDSTLQVLENEGIDLTGFFRTLTDQPEQLPQLFRAHSTAEKWQAELTQLRQETGTSTEEAQELMGASNPVYLPRNLALDAALRQVELGNQEPILRILEAVTDPYTRRPGYEDLESAPPQSHFFTSYCGT